MYDYCFPLKCVLMFKCLYVILEACAKNLAFMDY